MIFPLFDYEHEHHFIERHFIEHDFMEFELIENRDRKKPDRICLDQERAICRRSYLDSFRHFLLSRF
jgi:retron-type reverse transcriptase